jgi:lipoate-protein ligase A
MIWLNEQSVIVGKHQNAYAEINYPFVRNNKIPVIRRISGGGAVYHDAGNVNFSFIKKANKANAVDFSQFTSIIVKFFHYLGVEVTANKRNSLFIGDLKFSGNAEHLFHTKVLHHGTILFNTDLKMLKNCLSPELEYQSKALPSVRNDVVNIAPLLPSGMEIHQFIDLLVRWLSDYFPGSKAYEVTADESEEIARLAETKYKTWQWNFGYSPVYSFRVNIPCNNELIPILVKVENGKIVQIDQLQEVPDHDFSVSMNALIGTIHNEEEIHKFVNKNKSQLELAGITVVNLSKAFFK